MHTSEAEFDGYYRRLPYERLDIECKGCGQRSHRQFFPDVVRAVLAMANRRDGGRVILGVPEVDGNLEWRGLSIDELESWRRYDHLATLIAEYAEPSIRFDLDVFVRDGLSFVIIGVDEFELVPIICKRDDPDAARKARLGEKPALRKGSLYIRGHGKPASREVASYEEMRALIDLATEKGVRRFVDQARAAGLGFIGPQPPSDAERFDQQQGDLQ